SGEKLHYWKLGNIFRSQQVVTVVLNYSIYRKGFVEDMVEDLLNAFQWIKQNISTYGGDPSNLYAMGHSAGAHLIAMYLIKQSMHKFCEPSLLNSYNHISWDNSPTLKGFIGLSGVYDIVDHYQF